MSMLCSLYRITESQTQQLLACPDAVNDLLGNSPLPPKTRLLSRLFGMSRKDAQPAKQKLDPVVESEIFDLDHAWHILHYLLSGCDAEGEWPAAFIMSGGQDVGPDLGYGPTRLLSPALTQAVADFLTTQSYQNFDAAYVEQDILNREIYWTVSSEPTARQRELDELWSKVQGMQSYFEQTIQARGSILVQIY